MRIFNYLCDLDLRSKLTKFISENAPEIFECSTSFNNAYLSFNEYNHPSGVGRTYEKWDKPYPHVFMLVVTNGSGSQRCLWDDILYDTELSDFKNKDMGYKLGKGLLYPNLDIKIQNLIKIFIREYKIKVLLDINTYNDDKI